MKSIAIFKYILFSLLIVAAIPSLQAQVESRVGQTRDGETVRRMKDIPVRVNPIIQGDGSPTYLYVIQLARFENMEGIPSTFPKGTFLWVNPDYRSEMLLLSGFYEDRDKAYSDAQVWKKKIEFKGAFVRAKPFMVRYD